jgi:hypothetical protein
MLYVIFLQVLLGCLDLPAKLQKFFIIVAIIAEKITSKHLKEVAQKVSLERVAVSLERVEASLERLFSAIYCHESYFYTTIFL